MLVVPAESLAPNGSKEDRKGKGWARSPPIILVCVRGELSFRPPLPCFLPLLRTQTSGLLFVFLQEILNSFAGKIGLSPARTSPYGVKLRPLFLGWIEINSLTSAGFRDPFGAFFALFKLFVHIRFLSFTTLAILVAFVKLSFSDW